jgi:hypothetical protein
LDKTALVAKNQLSNQVLFSNVFKGCSQVVATASQIFGFWMYLEGIDGTFMAHLWPIYGTFMAHLWHIYGIFFSFRFGVFVAPGGLQPDVFHVHPHRGGWPLPTAVLPGQERFLSRQSLGRSASYSPRISRYQSISVQKIQQNST